MFSFADEVTLDTDTVLKKWKQHLLNNSQKSSFLIRSEFSTFYNMSGMHFSSFASSKKFFRNALFTYFLSFLEFTIETCLQKNANVFSNRFFYCRLFSKFIFCNVLWIKAELLVTEEKYDKNWLTRLDSQFFFALSNSLWTFLLFFYSFISRFSFNSCYSISSG
jgi:hypothetical protein